jgi:hypothetical protein
MDFVYYPAKWSDNGPKNRVNTKDVFFFRTMVEGLSVFTPFCPSVNAGQKKSRQGGLGVRAVVRGLPPQPQDAGKVEINVKK